MPRKLMIIAFAGAAITSVAFAQSSVGTAAAAKAMFDKAVAAMKVDKAKALSDFNAGTGGFKDRDLFPFCFNISDGVLTAAPASIRGKNMRTLKDSTGKAFGDEIFKAAQEGKVNQVSYTIPRPGQTQPVAKVSFVTKIGDQGCGVAYYK